MSDLRSICDAVSRCTNFIAIPDYSRLQFSIEDKIFFAEDLRKIGNIITRNNYYYEFDIWHYDNYCELRFYLKPMKH